MLLKQSTARSLTVLMIDSTDHIAGKTGLTLTITASKDGGSFASISPTVTELANGWYKLALTTSHTDTLGDLALHITGTGADATDIREQVVVDLPGGSVSSVTGAVGSVTGNVGGSVASVTARVTANTDQLAGQTVTAGAGVTFPSSVASPTNITAGTITTTTNLTNLPSIPANWITAAGITAAALNGKGDWNIGKTGYALSSAGIQAIWDALTSALTTVGSIGKLLVDNINGTITSRMASYTQPTGFLAATFPTTVASPTNITAGTITTVTNLTNAPTAGDLTAAMKTSVTTAATAATPTAAAVTGNVGGNVTGSVGSVASGGITSASFGASAIDAAALASDASTEIANAVGALVIEGTTTLIQSQRLHNAVLGGKASGLDTSTAVFRDIGDTKARVTATTDADGNRTAVTTDLT